MKARTKWLIAGNLLALLLYLGYYLNRQETILAEGRLVLLELAPVDPRSLMQGDYMDLDYAIAREVQNDSLPRRGYLVFRLDSLGVAQRVRLQAGTSPLHDGEHLIDYVYGGWRLRLGAEAWFFEEGTAEKYEAAEYGGLRIDDRGNSLLVGLYDEDRRLIE